MAVCRLPKFNKVPGSIQQGPQVDSPGRLPTWVVRGMWTPHSPGKCAHGLTMRACAPAPAVFPAAELEGAGKEAWSALGMPCSPFSELPALPELVRKDLYSSLDLLLALAGHLGTVSALRRQRLPPMNGRGRTRPCTRSRLPCCSQPRTCTWLCMWRWQVGHVCNLMRVHALT